MQQVEAMASGSVIRHFGPSHLKQMALHLPPMWEQRAIGQLSSIFAERLRLLRETNATLEAIAQALFKSWFVDFDPVRAKAEGREPEGMDAATAALFPSEFEASELGPIPKGWRVDGLGKISQNIREQARPEALEPSTSYIGLEHMPRKSIALADHGTAEGLASGKFWYRANDILFGKLRPYFHKVGVAIGDGVCSTDILVVRPISRHWLGYTAMQFSSDALVSYATQLSNGAKMPRTNWSDLAKYHVGLPSEGIAAAFDDIVRPMIARIHANIGHAQNLAELRDTLLPRLISGKLRLHEAEQEFAEVL
jgi:type I restriction enzyme S subunit